MLRTVQPELLDALPPHHPDAQRNRRDLRLVNWVQGSPRWFARVVPPLLGRADRLLELGAGTGELGLHLAPHLGSIRYAGLDRWPRPAAWPAEWPWWSTDLLDFQHYRGYTIVLGNLIFHHFTETELAGIGSLLRETTQVIVASEPARRRLHLWQLRLLGRFALSPTGRHDARVSVEGGFLGDELPRALGLSPREWRWRITTGFRGYYRMVAVRRGRQADG